MESSTLTRPWRHARPGRASLEFTAACERLQQPAAEGLGVRPVVVREHGDVDVVGGNPGRERPKASIAAGVVDGVPAVNRAEKAPVPVRDAGRDARVRSE